MAKGFKTGGRVAGKPNKATTEFRQTVTALLEDNAENVAKWLKLVAEGDENQDIKPDPFKALDMLSRLAEYATPKLARTELSADVTIKKSVADMTDDELMAVALGKHNT